MNRRGIVMVCVATLLLMGVGGTAAQDDGPTRIIFMHHSTGGNLIWQGNVREALTGLGYEFWDHGYNDDGLVDPEGNSTGVNWDVPGDNTDPDGWYEIFSQPVTDPPTNTFSHMLQYGVIIFKSCFPSSDIYDEEMFETYQRYYLSIRDVIDQHPDKLFIPFTTPPLVPNSTSPENARRAQRWAEYLTSDEYLAGHPNIFVFDIFSHLADEQGYLREEYRVDESDSHPNELANQTLGPIFVEFIDEAIHSFASGEPVALPTPEQPALEPGEGETGLIEDFEDESAFSETWWPWADEGAKVFECEPDQSAYSGDAALRLTLDLPLEVYAGCGTGFDPAQNWANTSGLRFFWQADSPDLGVALILGVEDPTNLESEGVTYFAAELPLPGNEWTPVSVPWDDFFKPDWVGEAGIDALDPTRVVELSFNVGHWEREQVGSIWIDDLQVVSSGQ